MGVGLMVEGLCPGNVEICNLNWFEKGFFLSGFVLL